MQYFFHFTANCEIAATMSRGAEWTAVGSEITMQRSQVGQVATLHYEDCK